MKQMTWPHKVIERHKLMNKWGVMNRINQTSTAFVLGALMQTSTIVFLQINVCFSHLIAPLKMKLTVHKLQSAVLSIETKVAQLLNDVRLESRALVSLSLRNISIISFTSLRNKRLLPILEPNSLKSHRRDLASCPLLIISIGNSTSH